LLTLLAYGATVGFLSFTNLDIWGSGQDRQHQPVYQVGFLVGLVTFLAGVLGFAGLGVKGFFSLVAHPGHRPSPQGSSQTAIGLGVKGFFSLVAHPGHRPSPQGSSPMRSLVTRSAHLKRPSRWALIGLRVTLIVVIAMACVAVQRDLADHPLGVYGFDYRTSAYLILFMTQLPYAAGLMRIWRGTDRIGLAIVMALGLMQIIVHLLMLYSIAHYPWLPRSVLPFVCAAVPAVLAYAAWHLSGLREREFSYLASIFAVVCAYTLLWQVVHASLHFRPTLGWSLRWFLGAY
jgi:hypothetical protein